MTDVIDCIAISTFLHLSVTNDISITRFPAVADMALVSVLRFCASRP